MVQTHCFARVLNVELADPSVDGFVNVNFVNNDYTRRAAYDLFRTFASDSRD